jgi:hypothetical protein
MARQKSGKGKKGGYGCQQEPELQHVVVERSEDEDAWPPPADWCAADALMAIFGLSRVRGEA